MTTSIRECCHQSSSLIPPSTAVSHSTVNPKAKLFRSHQYLTTPSNWVWRSPTPVCLDPPAVGYSVTPRGWAISKKYEDIVSQLSGMPYQEFAREYLINERLVLNTQNDHWDAENKVVVSSLYRHKVYAYIVNKAHDILWGLASSPTLTEDDWYIIHEHADQ